MKIWVWIGFAALCLLAGSGLTLESVLPHLLPGLAGLAIRLLLVAGSAAVLGRRDRCTSWKLCCQIAGWGAALFCSLPILFSAAGSKVEALTEVLLSALIPVGIIFFWAQAADGFGPESHRMNLLGPALAGLGGSALLISYTLPTRPAGWLWLGAMVFAAVLTGAAVLRLHELTQKVGVAFAVALSCAGGGVAALALSWMTPAA